MPDPTEPLISLERLDALIAAKIAAETPGLRRVADAAFAKLAESRPGVLAPSEAPAE